MKTWIEKYILNGMLIISLLASCVPAEQGAEVDEEQGLDFKLDESPKDAEVQGGSILKPVDNSQPSKPIQKAKANEKKEEKKPVEKIVQEEVLSCDKTEEIISRIDFSNLNHKAYWFSDFVGEYANSHSHTKPAIIHEDKAVKLVTIVQPEDKDHGVISIFDLDHMKPLKSLDSDEFHASPKLNPLSIDLNNDGMKEVLYLHKDGRHIIALDGSKGEIKKKWQLQLPYSLKKFSCSGDFSVHDINKDNRPDILLENIIINEVNNSPRITHKLPFQNHFANCSTVFDPKNNRIVAPFAIFPFNGTNFMRRNLFRAQRDAKVANINIDDSFPDNEIVSINKNGYLTVYSKFGGFLYGINISNYEPLHHKKLLVDFNNWKPVLGVDTHKYTYQIKNKRLMSSKISVQGFSAVNKNENGLEIYSLINFPRNEDEYLSAMPVLVKSTINNNVITSKDDLEYIKKANGQCFSIERILERELYKKYIDSEERREAEYIAETKAIAVAEKLAQEKANLEEQKKLEEEEAERKLEEEAKRLAEEEAKKKAEEEAKRLAEEEAKKKAEEARKKTEEYLANVEKAKEAISKLAGELGSKYIHAEYDRLMKLNEENSKTLYTNVFNSNTTNLNTTGFTTMEQVREAISDKVSYLNDVYPNQYGQFIGRELEKSFNGNYVGIHINKLIAEGQKFIDKEKATELSYAEAKKVKDAVLVFLKKDTTKNATKVFEEKLSFHYKELLENKAKEILEKTILAGIMTEVEELAKDTANDAVDEVIQSKYNEAFEKADDLLNEKVVSLLDGFETESTDKEVIEKQLSERLLGIVGPIKNQLILFYTVAASNKAKEEVSSKVEEKVLNNLNAQSKPLEESLKIEIAKEQALEQANSAKKYAQEETFKLLDQNLELHLEKGVSSLISKNASRLALPEPSSDPHEPMSLASGKNVINYNALINIYKYPRNNYRHDQTFHKMVKENGELKVIRVSVRQYIYKVSSNRTNSKFYLRVEKFLNDGSRDKSFSGDGIHETPYPDLKIHRESKFTGMRIQKDGKILVYGDILIQDNVKRTVYIGSFPIEKCVSAVGVPMFWVGSGNKWREVIPERHLACPDPFNPGKWANIFIEKGKKTWFTVRNLTKARAMGYYGKMPGHGTANPYVTDYITTRYMGALRLNTDGSFDKTYGENGLALGNAMPSLDRGVIDTIRNYAGVHASNGVMTNDGGLILLGRFTVGKKNYAYHYNAAQHAWGVTKFTKDGKLDNNFADGGYLMHKMSKELDELYERDSLPPLSAADWKKAKQSSLRQRFSSETATVLHETDNAYYIGGVVGNYGDTRIDWKVSYEEKLIKGKWGILKINKKGEMDENFGEKGKSIFEISDYMYNRSPFVMSVSNDSIGIVGGALNQQHDSNFFTLSLDGKNARRVIHGDSEWDKSGNFIKDENGNLLKVKHTNSNSTALTYGFKRFYPNGETDLSFGTNGSQGATFDNHTKYQYRTIYPKNSYYDPLLKGYVLKYQRSYYDTGARKTYTQDGITILKPKYNNDEQ